MFSSAVGGGRWRGALRTSATQSPTRRSPRATPCSWWATTSVKQSPARAAIETSAACCGAVYTTRRTAAASELKWKPATPPDIAPSRRAPRSSRRRFCPRLKSMAEEPARASSSVRLRSARMVAAKPSSSLATRAGAEKTRTPRAAPEEAPSIYLSIYLSIYPPIYLSIHQPTNHVGCRRPAHTAESAMVAVGGAPKGKPTGGRLPGDRRA